MKRAFLTICCMVLAIAGTMAANRLYIEDFSIEAGETKRVNLMMDNDIVFTAFQVDFVLPDGLTIGTKSNGKPNVTINTGTHRIEVINGEMTQPNGQAVNPADTYCTVTGPGGSVTPEPGGNRLYIEDFSIDAGETKRVNLMMDNDIVFTAFQVDFVLPDGLTIGTKSNGKPNVWHPPHRGHQRRDDPAQRPGRQPRRHLLHRHRTGGTTDCAGHCHHVEPDHGRGAGG